MRRVLVTGCAGFIGSHIAERFIENKWEVHGVDNISSGELSNIPKGMTFAWDDIRGYTSALEFDIVFNLAAIVGIPFSEKFPQETLDVNAGGVKNLLNLKCEKFVQASTAAIHHPDNPYATSKLEAENLIREKRKISKYRIIRFENVYGPRQKLSYGAVIPTFIERAKRNSPLVIHGDGSQERDFIHISDLSRISYELAYRTSGISDLGTGKSTSILQLAQDIIRLTGSKSEIQFARHPGGVESSQGSSETFPVMSLEDGLKTII